jgi:acetate kinase
MKPAVPSVLTINGGSSSIRFAVYEAGAQPRLRLHGKIDRIGLTGTNLIVDDPGGKVEVLRQLTSAIDHPAAVGLLLGWLEAQPIFASLKAVGHRIVHGMKHSEPARVTLKLLAELRRITAYDPDHLPREIALIEAFRKRHPKVPQVACFDTTFHRTMPRVAKLLPIPRRYIAKGVERYGFHGLSYCYLMEELGRVDPTAAKGRVILAHLGSGASLAAVRHGKSMDTSMGFTPTSGLVMSTRTGDIDPGLGYYLARTEHMTAAHFQQMVNHESGLLGISGSSSDLRDLLARERTDKRAADAVDLFCYQARKWIGSFAAALGGLDTLVFSAGTGENSPVIRSRICHGLDFLGIELSHPLNARNAPLISADTGRVKVRVIPTNEELMIARSVIRFLDLAEVHEFNS